MPGREPVLKVSPDCPDDLRHQKAGRVIVSCPDPTLKREKGLVNLGRILGPALWNFHAPIRLQNGLAM